MVDDTFEASFRSTWHGCICNFIVIDIVFVPKKTRIQISKFKKRNSEYKGSTSISKNKGLFIYLFILFIYLQKTRRALHYSKEIQIYGHSTSSNKARNT